MTTISRTIRLRQLRDPQCTRCVLHESAENVCVLGRGNAYGPIMILGEAPGRREAETGKPFMGTSGQWMQKHLIELAMEDLCYITNGVRCRPPLNRTPKRAERIACKPFLVGEIEIVNPKLVVAVGRSPLDALGMRIPRGDITWSPQWGRCVLFTWHPSFCLRQGVTSREAAEFVSHLKQAKKFALHLKEFANAVVR